MGLILLLWVPLLVFSSGNPTYQIPAVTSFHVNLTLGTLPPASPPGGRTAAAAAAGAAAALGFGALGAAPGAVQFPLYRAGDRGASAPWPGPGANGSSGGGGSGLPPEYQPEQVQQLCVSPVRLGDRGAPRGGQGIVGRGQTAGEREQLRAGSGGAPLCSGAHTS